MLSVQAVKEIAIFTFLSQDSAISREGALVCTDTPYHLLNNMINSKLNMLSNVISHTASETNLVPQILVLNLLLDVELKLLKALPAILFSWSLSGQAARVDLHSPASLPLLVPKEPAWGEDAEATKHRKKVSNG